MLAVQSLDCLFGAVSCFLLGGMSGVVANLISVIRNVLKIKELASKKTTIGIICVLFVSFFLTYKNWYSILPLLASIEYTVSVLVCKNYKTLKITLLINVILWFIYALLIQNYTSAIAMAIMFPNTLLSMREQNKKAPLSEQVVFE